MRAGLLRETLVFKSAITTRNEYGAITEEYEEIFRCRACRKKMSLIADKDGVSAMEQFIGHTLVFQVRNYPVIKENQHVVYNGNEYNLKMVNLQINDNSLLLTLEKIDT
ncbi:phage head completion protein [Bacteroides nordii]|uniref:phage head completion protein n=1 Tax=Bacteroides nordii TaxID=291645 RepID=UPI002041A603|nr:head-tail adaptor protein [Bacteroides nordii]GFZ38960.1 hypothetical protein BANORC5_09950 [Bacteroides nordii]